MASKEFSNRLKKLRKLAGYSQKEVYEHFNIPQSTFSSWEIGKSEPSGEMLIQLCEFYKCDIMKEFSDINKDMVTNIDLSFLEKYHALDKHGKEMVDFTLEKEYERSVAEKKKSNNITPIMVRETSDYSADAAHAMKGVSDEDKAFDENIMNSEDF